VVLIEAAGHSPGSQMIYIRLQTGAGTTQEYLLVGDVVWNSLSLQRETGRAWLASLSLNEPRDVHANQVRALINLQKAEPALHMVISHDGAQIEAEIKEGLLGGTFEE
jgi:hypothetical protein